MVQGARSCPACGNSYSQEYVGIAETIPQIPGSSSPRPNAETQPCPMCSEPIARGSTRCKWCGENLADPKPSGMGAPPYQPAQPQPYYPPPPAAAPSGTTVLVVGLLSIIVCNWLGPVAWVMGNNYEKQCRALGVPPDGAGTGGKILGIIGTVLMGLCCLGGTAWVVLGAATGAVSR